MERLPDELICMIIKLGTSTCLDCPHDLLHYKSSVRICKDCGFKACKHHSRQRFRLAKTYCNNCYLWNIGHPAAARGSRNL